MHSHEYANPIWISIQRGAAKIIGMEEWKRQTSCSAYIIEEGWQDSASCTAYVN